MADGRRSGTLNMDIAQWEESIYYLIVLDHVSHHLSESLHMTPELSRGRQIPFLPEFTLLLLYIHHLFDLLRIGIIGSLLRSPASVL